MQSGNSEGHELSFDESNQMAATLEDAEGGETKNEEGDDDQVSPLLALSRTKRRNHLASLIMDQQAARRYSMMKLTQMESKGALFRQSMLSGGASSLSTFDITTDEGVKAVAQSVTAEGKTLADERVLQMITGKLVSTDDIYSFPMEVRIQNLTYTALVDPADAIIKTVYNSSNLYWLRNWCRKTWGRDAAAPAKTEKVILHHIHLVLKPGTQYLVLGAPGAGKSTLLKAIAGRLSAHSSKDVTMTGIVEYNGKPMRGNENLRFRYKDEKKFHIENAVAYIDQLDRHAPRLSVEETFEFAYQCKTGGISPRQSMEDALTKAGNENAVKEQQQKDALPSRVKIGLESLGLTGVKDTFVGDSTVRGVSGGQRRRVTVGEMIMDRTVRLFCFYR